jgi:3-hydroxyacyl-CoA dehydrogenase / enoyl-CoA hydratase / 3-hydroxybutyryl-CoA epimerase
MTSAVRYDRDVDGVVTLTLDQPGQSTNVMNAEYVDAMDAAVDRLERERDDVLGVIVTSAKDTFFAGGDLTDLQRVTGERLEEFAAFLARAKGQLRRLERLGRPVVAAINGSALGGGLEIALACHHRIVRDDSSVRLGFPEVTLGLMPGCGGVVRSVRLLGLPAALPLLVEGTQLRPAAAVEAGLVHELAADADELLAKAAAWIRTRPEGTQPWDRPGFVLPGPGVDDAQGYLTLSVAPAMLTVRTHGAYPAPERIMAAAVEGAFVDVDTALAVETRYFLELVTSQVAKNMIGTLWFGRNEVLRGASRPAGFERTSVRRLGVLGAGMMGAGIAYVSAYAGIDVVLKDVSTAAAEAGRQRIAALLDERVGRGRMSAARRDEILARVSATDTDAELAGCDLVIEAVFEDRELKNTVLAAAEQVTGPEAFLASNTSTLPITGLAEAVTAPDRFVGLHFFSPVHKMPLVEIIRGTRTSEQTLARAFDFVRQIGKMPIVVNDSRGFFTSRVFGTYLTEGVAMVVEGVPPAVVENVARKAGLPVGPLAVADEVSLSLVRRIRSQEVADLAAEGRRPADHPAYTVLDRMVTEFDRPGKAAGAGFYDYPAVDGASGNGQSDGGRSDGGRSDGGRSDGGRSDAARKQLWPELSAMFATGPGDVPEHDVRDRLLFIQALETLRCLDEGVVTTERDANIGSIFGIGFPAWTGGAAQFVEACGGREAFAERAEELARRYGDRFRPPMPVKS